MAEVESGQGGGVGAYDATTVLRLLPCGPECPPTIKQQQQQQVEPQRRQEVEQQQVQGEQQEQEQAAPGSTQNATANSKQGSKGGAAAVAAAAAPLAAVSGKKTGGAEKRAGGTTTAAAPTAAAVASRGSRHLSKAEKQALSEQVSGTQSFSRLSIFVYGCQSIQVLVMLDVQVRQEFRNPAIWAFDYVSSFHIL